MQLYVFCATAALSLPSLPSKDALQIKDFHQDSAASALYDPELVPSCSHPQKRQHLPALSTRSLARQSIHSPLHPAGKVVPGS